MTVVEAMAAAHNAYAPSHGTGGPSGPPPVNGILHPITLKAQDEILTSLHLIKDIRRLETYQRDFFLKVKESLNHVQLLLDHQLIDMAWSDNLIACEESLLKASVHLAGSTPAQIAELYSLLLQDRDKLSHRFQELSVKSSLSEYVVNSRSLLDIDTVHVATEAILRNEKAVQPQPDQSIPVDHTFFLANFCTTSIASSMFASFMPPKPKSHHYSHNAVNHHGHPHVAQNPRYDHPSGLKAAGSPHGPSGVSVASPISKGGSFYSQAGPMPSGHGLYNGHEYITAAAVHAAAASHTPEDLANTVFGHELVTAISQITRGDEAPVPVQKLVGHAPGGHAVPGGSRKMPTTELWGGSGPDKSLLLQSDTDLSNGFISQSNGKGNGATPKSESGLVDGCSESVTSESDDGRNAVYVTVAGQGVSPIEFDGSKPLSFARIASLNLEKQAVQRPPSIGLPANGSLPPPSGPPGVSGVSDLNLLDRSSPLLGLQPQPASRSNEPMINPTANLGSIMVPPPSNNPRYYLEISMEGKRLGRAIIEVEPMVAPKMSQNFGLLVTAERGYGYKGCQFFQAWKNESVICGDWEHNSGRGGRSALEGGPLFTPDETRLPCVRGAVGMRRMSKKHSSLNQVASQFRIILANMNTQFTGIFGRVVDGIDAMDKVANIGGEGGRPEKVAVISACGIYKS